MSSSAALTAVIGSSNVHAAGYAFAFAPVAINCIALVTLAVLIHRWTGHSYPHRQASEAEVLKERSAAGFESGDLDRALEDLGEAFDISRGDLEIILWRAEIHAQNRRKATI
jgi:CBS domain-containing membrane protein